MPGKVTLHDPQFSAGRRRWIQVPVDDAKEAAAAKAGVSILSCEPDPHVESIRSASPAAWTGFRAIARAAQEAARAARDVRDIQNAGAALQRCLDLVKSIRTAS